MASLTSSRPPRFPAAVVGVVADRPLDRGRIARLPVASGGAARGGGRLATDAPDAPSMKVRAVSMMSKATCCRA
jgi:hypothetical protein